MWVVGWVLNLLRWDQSEGVAAWQFGPRAQATVDVRVMQGRKLSSSFRPERCLFLSFFFFFILRVQRKGKESSLTNEDDVDRFGTFFNHIDHFPAEVFLYLTSGGLAACQASAGAPSRARIAKKVDVESDSEGDGQSDQGG